MKRNKSMTDIRRRLASAYAERDDDQLYGIYCQWGAASIMVHPHLWYASNLARRLLNRLQRDYM